MSKLDLSDLISEVHLLEPAVHEPPPLGAPKKRRPLPPGRGQDIPDLLKESRAAAHGHLRTLLGWSGGKERRPHWLVAAIRGWSGFIPYISTGRVTIAGLSFLAVDLLVRQGHPPHVIARLARQRGIETLSEEALRRSFPRTSNLLDANVASMDDATGLVRVQARGLSYWTQVDAVDLAMAWIGTPPPHRVMVTTDPEGPVVLYDARGYCSIVAAASWS